MGLARAAPTAVGMSSESTPSRVPRRGEACNRFIPKEARESTRPQWFQKLQPLTSLGSQANGMGSINRIFLKSG